MGDGTPPRFVSGETQEARDDSGEASNIRQNIEWAFNEGLLRRPAFAVQNLSKLQAIRDWCFSRGSATAIFLSASTRPLSEIDMHRSQKN